MSHVFCTRDIPVPRPGRNNGWSGGKCFHDLSLFQRGCVQVLVFLYYPANWKASNNLTCTWRLASHWFFPKICAFSLNNSFVRYHFVPTRDGTIDIQLGYEPQLPQTISRFLTTACAHQLVIDMNVNDEGVLAHGIHSLIKALAKHKTTANPPSYSRRHRLDFTMVGLACCRNHTFVCMQPPHLALINIHECGWTLSPALRRLDLLRRGDLFPSRMLPWTPSLDSV